MSAKDVKLWTPLHNACNNGHINIAKLLVSHGSNVSDVTDRGRNSLHIAALQGHSLVVEFLQTHGIDSQLQDKHGWYPLHLAVKKGHKKVVQILLQQPNKNNIINKLVYDDQFKCKLAPLHLAIKGKFTDVVEILLQHKADVMLVDSQMYTPFHTACSIGSVHIAKLLLEHGAEAKCVHEDSGSTSLHNAVCSGSHALVEFLLTDNRSEQFVNLGDNNLWTPLHFACQNGYHHIAACLLKYGACTDSKTKQGRTAFHLAAIKDHLKCSKVLLEYKVDVNVKDNNGCTALDLASQQCQLELVKLIFDHNPSLIKEITTDNYIEHPQFKNTRFTVSMSDSNDDGSAVHHFTTQECHLATIEHFFLTEGLAFNRMAIDSKDDNGRTPLYIAVMKDRYDVAKILIQMGADISLSDLKGWTPLHVACKNGHTGNVKLLVFHGADINRVTTIRRHSPLHLAIEGEFIKIIQVLLEEKVDVMLKDHDQYTPLHAACSTGNVFIVKLLLEHGADAKCIHQESGSSSLHKAVCSGSLELVEFLLSQCKSEESKKIVNLSDKNGWSPLHFACQNGKHHIATCLLKYGANVDSKTNTGRNVMHVSCLDNDEHVKCINCILEHLQTFEPSHFVTIISTPDNDGMTPLHIASQKGLHKIVKNFLSHKGISALVNSQDKTGRTPIYLAVMEGRLDVTKTLLKFKSDITLRDSKHWTPLHVACDKGYGKIANLLILKGASVKSDMKCEKQVDSFETLEEWSPLHLAVQKGHKDIVELILKHSKENIDRLVFDSSYKSYRPIDLAVKGGFTDIISLLLTNGAKVMSHNAEAQTPLVVACKTGNIAVVKMLVDNGAKLEYDGLSLTSLHYAVITGSLKLVEFLLSLSNSNELINCCDYEGFSPLHFACQYGYYQITLKLLTFGAKVNNKSKIGRTPLHLAAFEGFIDCFEALLSFGAVMDIQDNYGWTDIMLATQEGHHEIVKILCEHSAKLDLKCHGGRNVAHVACAHGQVKCLEYIVEQRNSMKIISDEDEDGLTPFHHACKEGHLEVIKLLQSQRLCSVVNSKSSKSITPLQCAVINGRYNVIELFFQMGFKVSMEDLNQSLYIASRFGYMKIVELLITKGALINSLTFMGRNSLHLASFSGHVSTALLLIDKGISYLLKDEDGWTPLHLAAQQGHVSTVKTLLQQLNIQVNCQSENMRTPLHSCSYHGNVLIAELLLNMGSDLTLQDENGWTALHLCAQQGHIKVVQKLVHKGANPNVQSKTKRAPIHLACMKGKKHVVEYLLRKGAEIDIKDFNQWTPLCDACQDNHTDIVDLLIKYKADVNTKIASGRTCLHLVAFKGFLEACKLLLKTAINVNSKDNEGWTALHLAAQEGFLEIVELLDKQDADLEATANDGRTPLDMCSASGHVKIVEYLISRGAKFNKPDIIYHWTPFHWACKFGHLEVAEKLLTHKVSINDVTLGGHSALHLCILDGHRTVAELLIEKGINVEIEDKDGKTALHFACEYGHEHITELLLQTEKFKIDAVDNKKWTPLHYACNNSQESSAVVSQLLNRCNIYLCTDSGKNCLHLAALNGGIEVCKLLLENDKEQKLLICQDENGWSPLHLASYTGRLDIVELFVTKYKADVKVSSIYGWTPLHLAILMYNSDVQNFLLSKESALDLESLYRFIKSLFEKDKKELDMIRKHFLGVEAARLPVERKKKAEKSTPCEYTHTYNAVG